MLIKDLDPTVAFGILHRLIDLTPDMIVAIDRQYRLLMINEAGLRQFRDEIGIEPVLGMNVPDSLTVNNVNNWKERHDRAFNGISTHSVDSFPMPDRMVWAQIQVEPLIVDGAIIGSTTRSRDITEETLLFQSLRDSLEDRDMVLKEIHHRVKNNMSTVRGLLGLDKHSLETDQARSALQNAETRLTQMMMLYDKLHRDSDFKTVSSQEYLEDLIRSVVNTFELPINTSLDIEEIPLPVATASTLGLIINELIVNSMKYAFRPDRKNLLTLTFRGEEEGILLRIEDNGPGFDPDHAPLGTGFGMELVDSFVARMKGSRKLDSDGRTCWEIVFPLED